jgi:transposase
VANFAGISIHLGVFDAVASFSALSHRAQHVEVMWLTGRLAPDHKTIADFREDNGPAIKEGLRAIRRVVPQDGPAGEEGPRRRFPDASKS